MALIYPNIVPQNNLRLPDALTVKYGPAPLLSRFVLEGDKFVRESGIRLRLRHDFDELVYINKHEVAAGSWFPLINMFNPKHTDLSPEDSYWLSGETDSGEIVLTWAARVYYWPDTSFKEEARLMFCERGGTRQPCIVTAPDASLISGVVFWGGSFWIHPDYRRLRLSGLVGRLGRCFAISRWPVDWIIAVIQRPMIEIGIANTYGYRHTSPSIFYPGSPAGDVEAVLAYLSADEAYEDLAWFLGRKLGTEEEGVGSSTGERRLLHTVTSPSPEDVLQGSSNRS